MAENWYWLPRSWMILHDTTKTYPKRMVCGVHRFLQFGCTQVCSSSHHVTCVGNICRQPAVNSHCTTRFAGLQFVFGTTFIFLLQTQQNQPGIVVVQLNSPYVLVKSLFFRQIKHSFLVKFLFVARQLHIIH